MNEKIAKTLFIVDKRKERIISLLFLAVVLISISAVLLYDQRMRDDYRAERTYRFERAHEHAYSSLYLFTQQMNTLYNQQLLDVRLNDWLRNPGELKEDMLELSYVQKSFIGLIQSHPGLDSIYLHNAKVDRILSTSFMLTNLENFPHREVLEAYYESGSSALSVTTPAGSNERLQGRGLLSFVAGIPNLTTARHGAIALNYDLDYIREEVLSESDSFVWIDAADRMILAENDAHRHFYEDYQEPLLATQQTSFTLHDHYVIRSESPDGSWKLLTIIPHHELYANRPGTSTTLLIVVLLGVIAALLPHIYFYYIKRRRERWFQTRVESNLTDLQTGLLHDLLSGKPHSELTDKAAEYQIDLHSDAYQVVVFEIDDYYNQLTDTPHQERLLMNKIISNAIKWSFKVRFNAYTINAEFAKIAVLIGYSDVTEDDGLSHDLEVQEMSGTALNRNAELQETIRYIQHDITEHYGLTVCAGISEQVADISQINEAYVHALLALDYKSVYGKGSVIEYTQLPVGKSDLQLGYVHEYAQKLASYLNQGDIEAVEQLVDDLIRHWVSSGLGALDGLHALFGNLLSSVMKFALEQRIDLHKQYKEDLFFRLYSYEFVEEKRNYLLDICRRLIEELNTDYSKKNGTVEWIIEYIGKNYDRPISLGILADKIAMSPSYLSALIKTHLGVGFVDYISQLRIQKAVRLLEDDRLTVQEIAEQCGYDTIHTFIRQFKKMHRLPPNEFRKLRKREQENM